MPQLIPFFTTLPATEASLWLATLNRTLAPHRVCIAADISDDQAPLCQMAIIANPAPEQLLRFTGLQWLQSLWAGVEKVLHTPELAHLPVVRMNDPGLTRAMTEAVLTWTLYLHRLGPCYRAQQQHRQWQEHPYVPAEQRPVTVLGAGRLGGAAAAILSQHGFPVTTWSRSPRPCSPGIQTLSGITELSTALQKADILINLLPDTPETRNLLTPERLKLLPQHSGFINFGRGSVVPEEALLAGLTEARPGAAVLDVFATEPLPEASPLWSHPMVTVLPHISGPTVISSAAEVATANILGFINSGRIPDAADRSRGY